MAWIEFHPTEIIRLEKFYHLRVAMSWSVGECLGHLGLFWGQTLEVREDGDVTGWTGPYVSGLLSFGAQVSEKFLENLKQYRWIDPPNKDGRELIHDWLDYTGPYLRGRYAKEQRDKLVAIWALYGRTYGNQVESNRKPSGNQQTSKRTLPNQTEPNQNPKSLLVQEGLRLATLLRDLMLVNDPAAKVPKDLTEWAEEADRIIRLDSRKPEEIEQVITWCQNDTFWKFNILSVGKLRKQFPQLLGKMKTQGAKNASTQRGSAGYQPGKYDDN